MSFKKFHTEKNQTSRHLWRQTQIVLTRPCGVKYSTAQFFVPAEAWTFLSRLWSIQAVDSGSISMIITNCSVEYREEKTTVRSDVHQETIASRLPPSL